VIATVVFSAVGVAQLIGIANTHNDFARYPIPGGSTRWISTSGTNAIWLEPETLTLDAGASVTVTEVATGRELPVRDRRGVARYETLSRSGRTIGEVDIPARGRYAVVVLGVDRGSVAIGPVPPRRWYMWAWVWFGFAGAALVGAIVAGAFALRGRQSSVDDHDLVAA
jgi:hypothetical protein